MVSIITELETKARQNEPLPPNLTSPEKLLFLSLRILYREYKNKTISVEQAKREKLDIINSFEVDMVQYKSGQATHKRLVLATDLLKRIETDGCELCQHLIKILDGRNT